MPKCFLTSINKRQVWKLKGKKVEKDDFCWFVSCFLVLLAQCVTGAPEKTKSFIMMWNNFLTFKFFFWEADPRSDGVAVKPAGGALLWWETPSSLGWKQDRKLDTGNTKLFEQERHKVNQNNKHLMTMIDDVLVDGCFLSCENNHPIRVNFLWQSQKKSNNKKKTAEKITPSENVCSVFSQIKLKDKVEHHQRTGVVQFKWVRLWVVTLSNLNTPTW